MSSFHTSSDIGGPGPLDGLEGPHTSHQIQFQYGKFKNSEFDAAATAAGLRGCEWLRTAGTRQAADGHPFLN